MLRAVIVDDEKPAIDLLRTLLKKNNKVDVVGSFQSSINTINEMPRLNPDVVFLDIEMPEMSGIELASNVISLNNHTEIVFITAYNQYAVDAFKVNAIDYLLKPVLQEDIDKTVDRVLKRINYSFANHDISPIPRIYCFGSFQVYNDFSEYPLKWRTAKSKELFAYFFQNRGRSIAKWKICEVIWPEVQSTKVDVQLHTTIYKIKKVLIQANINVVIKFVNGYYIMDLPEVYSDVGEFQKIVDSEVKVTQKNFERYENAIFLYNNNYLEDNEYIWSVSMKEIYLEKFIQVSLAVIKFYTKNHNYEKAIEITKKALKMVPFDDAFNEILLNLYMKKHDTISFINHYDLLIKMFRNELGIEPSNSIKELYRKFT